MMVVLGVVKMRVAGVTTTAGFAPMVYVIRTAVVPPLELVNTAEPL
jgi:hypothetical protein